MQQTGITEAEAKAFFDRFVDAFATFDGNQVAELFAVPAVTCRTDGALVSLATRRDLVEYYQTALDRYRGSGCASCEWHDLQLVPMGTRSTVASVSWQLLRHDKSLLSAWRQSYCLVSTKGGLKSYAAASHAP